MEVSYTSIFIIVINREGDGIMPKPGYMIGEVYKNLLKKRATILYPFKEKELVHLPEGFRGKLVFHRDKCIGCQMCFRVCPAQAIKIIEDEKGKRPVFFMYRCIYCASCAEYCPVKAIEVSNVFENIAFDKETLVVK
ncbi:MAG: ferredoxin [Thermofilum sp. ex4484_82]|nr:MAG: ferredoxin [Thermofilum sp. ex4484_82]OYT38717.1 MAG: ferredoxin [Archaeoglobales archaeon ex4484_92]